MDATNLRFLKKTVTCSIGAICLLAMLDTVSYICEIEYTNNLPFIILEIACKNCPTFPVYVHTGATSGKITMHADTVWITFKTIYTSTIDTSTMQLQKWYIRNGKTKR